MIDKQLLSISPKTKGPGSLRALIASIDGVLQLILIVLAFAFGAKQPGRNNRECDEDDRTRDYPEIRVHRRLVIGRDDH